MADEIYSLFVNYKDAENARRIFDEYYSETSDDFLRDKYLELVKECKTSGELEERLIYTVTLSARSQVSKLQHSWVE
jgi:hypothetical protein